MVLILLGLVLGLSGCVDLFALPNVAVSSDGQWVAFLIPEASGAATIPSLKALNVNDGTLLDIGFEGDYQGAFDWHPTTSEIAYYNVSFDGTPTIKVSDINSDPAGLDYFGPFAFPRPFYVTQLAYSPDGTRLALSVILFPDGADLRSIGSVTFDMASAQAAVYVAELSAGTVTAVTELGGLFPSTLAWSPDGSKIAFAAWADGNGDGLIDVSGAGLRDVVSGIPADLAGVYVVDAGGGAVNKLSGDNLVLSPTWLDNSTLAAISLRLDAGTGSGGTDIVAFNVADGSSSILVPGNDRETFTTVSAAPDGSKIAYTAAAIGVATLIGDDQLSDERAPTRIMVSDLNGEPAAVYEDIGEFGTTDVPVWSPDGSRLFITAAHPFAALLGMVAAHDPSAATAQQQIVLVDLSAPGAGRMIYEGPQTTSGLAQYSLFGQEE
jgi:Tol biopolymer transport system component